MPVTLRPIGQLKSYIGGNDEVIVPAGMSIRDTLRQAGIPPEIVALVAVNDVHQADKDIILKDGDSLKVMAVIGGG